MLESFLNLLRRFRWVSLVAALCLLAFGAWQARGVSVNDSPEHWMPRSTVENWERFAEHFEFGDTVAIGLEFREGVRDQDIEFLKSLRTDLSQVPGVIKVTDISLAAELIEFAPLTDIIKSPTGDRDPYEIYRGVLFDDPRVWNPDDPDTLNRTLLMLVEIDATIEESLNERRRVAMREIHAILERHARPDVAFHPAGAVVIQYELERIARRIVIKLVPVALLLMLVTLGIAFRSPAAILIALAGGGWAIAVLIGAVVTAGATLNVVTVGGPILMVVITIATTVHIAHFYSALDRKRILTAAVKRRNVQRFVRWIAVPCLGAALTTGFGFLMLTFNELLPLQELGIELFVGSILAFFGCYFVWLALPTLHVVPGVLLSTSRMLPWVQQITRRPVATVILSIPVMGAAAYASAQVKVAVDPFEFFEEESYVAQALEHYADREFGHYTLDVILIPKHLPEDPVERAAARAENRRAALEFQKRIENRIEVRRVISEANFRRRLAKFDQARAEAWANGSPLQAGQELLRAEVLRQIFESWFVDHRGEDAMRITFLVDDPGTGFRPLLSAVRTELNNGASERFDDFFTGTAASVAVLTEQLVGAMARGLAAAMLTMAVVCVVLFRSVRLMLIAFLPNVFPILVVFGVMGVFGIPLNSGSAMVATIALGVGLNDTVHFVMHYRGHRLSGLDCTAAVNETFSEIARPMIITSVVNCAGFAIFLLAEFRPLYHFGLLASIAMAAALAGDLILLPNLLRVFDRRTKLAAKR